MAYQVPSAADLIARYPAFAAVAPATIDIHLADAATSGVDQSWLEADYAPAIAALAAHRMTLLGIGAHGEAANYARQGVSEIKSGGFQAKFADKHVGTAASGKLEATPYGQAYAVMLRRNKGGPRLVGAGPAVGGWGPLEQQNDGGIVPWVS
jgi:hypothetical protein